MANDGYAPLERRLHAGEAPPKSADEYAPELPQGITIDALKGDPLFAGFLKGAHAKGMNNAQVSYAISEFQQRMALVEQQRNNPEVAEAELRKVWKDDAQLNAGLTQSYRGARAFAVDDDHAQRLEKKFGNDPDFIQLMAGVGKELGEDTPPAGLTTVETETLDSLKRNPAYLDAKHPEHGVIVAKVSALYRKLHPD